jgi:hypothetical protein
MPIWQTPLPKPVPGELRAVLVVEGPGLETRTARPYGLPILSTPTPGELKDTEDSS